MRRVWFKREHVESIVTGAKTTTTRAVSNRLPSPGERVELSVGPRPAFACADVVDVTPLPLDAITDATARADGIASAVELRDGLVRMYGGSTALVLVRFAITA